MTTEILNEAVSDALTVKSLILTAEKLRSLASTEHADYSTARANPIIADLVKSVPDLSSWRVLDHCASLTRLYAVFERFIAKTIRNWLSEFPSVCGPYSGLEESFRTVHRRGVAKVLMDLDKDRFSYLGVEPVLEGLLKAVGGQLTYSILPEAFLSDPRSLKRDRIDELFSQVRLEGGWDWVSKHRFVTAFIEDTRGNQNTPEAELRSFVNYRNEAAHGQVDQFLGPNPLSEFADFIVAVCKAIDELVRWNWVRFSKTGGRIKSIGNVTERFRDNIVVAKVHDCSLKPATQLLLWGQNYCFPAIIESIQLNDVNHQEVNIAAETEVGLKLNVSSPKHPELLLAP